MKKFAFLKPQQCARVENAVQKHRLTRLLTDYSALAFCYGVFLFLYELPLIREPVAAVHPVLIAWAGVLTLYSILVRRLWEKVPLWQLLVAFAVTAGVTAVANRQAGLVGNLKAWVLAALPLAAFLPLCTGEKGEKNLLRALSGGAAVAMVASLVGIVMYLLRISAPVELFGSTHMVGYRYYQYDDPNSGILLYGIYADPNFASAYAVIFAAYSVWLLDACRRGLFGKGMKVFAWVSLVAQLCYFPLANSRGGWLCLAVAGVVCAFLYCFCTRLKTEGKLRRGALSLVAAVVAVALLCGGLLLVRSGLAVASNAIRAVPGTGELVPGDDGQTAGKEALWGNASQSVDVFEKEDDGFGAGRLIIWGEALRLYTHHPVLGVGVNNSTYYARLYAFGERLRVGFSIHNSYLDVLVYCGGLGFLALMGFFVGCAWLVLRRFFKNGAALGGADHLCAFGVLFLAGVSAFLSCCFVDTTAMYYLMLCMLSFLIKDVK